MPRRVRVRISTLLRLLICGTAGWYVLSTVSLRDRVVTAADGQVLVGSITQVGQQYRIFADDAVRVLTANDIARDKHGARQLNYGLVSIWRGSGKLLLLAGVAFFLIVPLCQAIRLRWVLRVQQVHLGWRESIRLAFAGNFLNFAAPFGSTAGDAYKAWYAAQRTPRRTEAVTLVLVDRVLGLAVLLATVGLIAAVCPPESTLAPLRAYVLSLLGLLTLGLAIYLAPPLRNHAALRRLVARLPQAERLARIDQAMLSLLSHGRLLARAVAVTLVLQVAAAASFFCTGLALGLDLWQVSAWEVYAYFSTGEIVKAIPGPPQGLGTMELAYGFLFAGLGSSSQVVSAALAVRLVNLVWALPGVLFMTAAQRSAAGRAQVAPRQVPVSATA